MSIYFICLLHIITAEEVMSWDRWRCSSTHLWLEYQCVVSVHCGGKLCSLRCCATICHISMSQSCDKHGILLHPNLQITSTMYCDVLLQLCFFIYSFRRNLGTFCGNYINLHIHHDFGLKILLCGIHGSVLAYISWLGEIVILAYKIDYCRICLLIGSA
jgi:hypothetical protein